jgi:hypothetical protein
MEEEMMDKAANFELVKMDYHRNGIGGVGFHVAIFIDHRLNDMKMLGIQFDNDKECYCAVFSLALLAKENIDFGTNSWRGDNYEDLMRMWSETYDKEQLSR